MTDVAILISKEKRKRFNSIRLFASSGAFIIGPAISGTLTTLTSIDIIIWINVLFFVLAALLQLFLPDKETIDKKTIPPLTVSQIIRDFTVVREFMLQNKHVTFIYIGFIVIMIFSFAMDAQEVVFTQKVIGLSHRL